MQYSQIDGFIATKKNGTKSQHSFLEMQTKPQETYPGRNRWGQEKGNESDLGERVEGELGDGEELVLGDEALGAAVELAEPLVQGHDLLLRDC